MRNLEYKKKERKGIGKITETWTDGYFILKKTSYEWTDMAEYSLRPSDEKELGFCPEVIFSEKPILDFKILMCSSKENYEKIDRNCRKIWEFLDREDVKNILGK